MYENLTEKESSFKCRRINNINELEELVNVLSSCESLRFRGVNQAKYSMLTSLQRLCPDGCSHKVYMRNLLTRVKTNSDVCNFFSDNKIAINDLSCIALMQHLELPTPFLDFTVDIKIALAFAAYGVDFSSISKEIEEYCSLYYFDLKSECEVGLSLQTSLCEGKKKGIEVCNEYYEAHPGVMIDNSILRKIDEFIRWDELDSLEFAFIEYQNFAPEVCTLDSQILDLTNPNLSKQKGGFAINLYKEDIPFECNWNMRSKENRMKLSVELQSGEEFPFKGMHTNKMMNCIDIRKEVINEWNMKNKIDLYDKSGRVENLKKILVNIKKELDENLLN